MKQPKNPDFNNDLKAGSRQTCTDMEICPDVIDGNKKSQAELVCWAGYCISIWEGKGRQPKVPASI